MGYAVPKPTPTVKRTLRLLPHRPGAYLMRDAAGRVIYVGRSRDLAARVRSYWVDLKDRPHLARMLGRVQWVEPVVCESEHEAAFLESDLLERHPTRYNRTLGMESCVWIRLDARASLPSLEVIHDVAPHDGAEWFGPYLGWEPARQAAAGLQRLYPLRYSGTSISRSERELARSLGVAPADRVTLARQIRGVLRREAVAVRETLRALEQARDRAARMLQFESAHDAQEQMRGLRWITQPQKLAGLDRVDGNYAAVSTADRTMVEVVLELRAGQLAQRRVSRITAPASSARARDDAWSELARENADLMAKLAAADALGPFAWRNR